MAELTPIADRFKSTGLDIRSHPYREDVTAASYTAVQQDEFTLKRFNSASAQTWTIPPDSAVVFDDGVTLTGVQIGAGVVTIVGGAGVTVTPHFGAATLASKGAQAIFQVIRLSANNWLAIGDIG